MGTNIDMLSWEFIWKLIVMVGLLFVLMKLWDSNNNNQTLA